jgi:hypothetical protein
MATDIFKLQFVKAIPDDLADGVIYVSMDYRTVVHKCACGCGRNVITPLGVTGWTLSYNGKVSLSPSIGNWDFPCRSHYWIRDDSVSWAESWSDDKVEALKASERQLRDGHHGQYAAVEKSPQSKGFWGWVRAKLHF